MAFADFPPDQAAVALLQRSLERGRLGHAYLFTGDQLDALEPVARTLAKTLNCLAPPRQTPAGVALDSCDHCVACRQIDGGGHADVHWLRPESKLRLIRAEPLRELLHTLHLKANGARWKMAVIVAADRMNETAANAFLKTLEEPPPDSVLVLLSTEPQRLLETVLSRCLRLSFGAGSGRPTRPEQLPFLQSVAPLLDSPTAGTLARYKLLDTLFQRLAALRDDIAGRLGDQSPANRYPDASADLQEQWEDELAASIEAEYRRRRAELIDGFHWWLRDVWLHTQDAGGGRQHWPELEATSRAIARRIGRSQAQGNLDLIERVQRQLHTNVQESLALEVCLLRLQL